MNDQGQRPVITPQMIALYDDYTHLSPDRRKFMEAMAKVAGSMTAAVAATALMAANAKAQPVIADGDSRIKTAAVTWPGATGEMKGYWAQPAGVSGKLPAVIVVHENRGLVPHIRDVTRRMSLEGFVALGVDFLSPLGGTPENEDEARALFGQLNAADVAANGAATVAWLAGHEATNGNVGAIGFCWGGGTVNAIAVASAALRAAVPYYGAQPPAADVPRIEARLMAHYGGLDERINAGIPAFEAALTEARVDHQIFIYEGVNHAFNNDTSEARYHPEAAMLAWQRTVDFLHETLDG
ncbi:MAG: dienelactone hydrolase family protein [Cucumibacter sp.]